MGERREPVTDLAPDLLGDLIRLENGMESVVEGIGWS
jgi:hypothetical protein